MQLNNEEENESEVEFTTDDESNKNTTDTDTVNLAKETLKRPKLKPIIKKGSYCFNVMEGKDNSQDYESMNPEDYKHKIKLPQNFNQAYNHPNEWIRSKWRAAIK